MSNIFTWDDRRRPRPNRAKTVLILSDWKKG